MKSVQEVEDSGQFDGTAGEGLLTDPTVGAENAATEVYFLGYHGSGTDPTWTLTATDDVNDGNDIQLLTGTSGDMAMMVPFRVPSGFSLTFATSGKDATGWLTIGYRVVAEG